MFSNFWAKASAWNIFLFYFFSIKSCSPVRSQNNSIFKAKKAWISDITAESTWSEDETTPIHGSCLYSDVVYYIQDNNFSVSTSRGMLREMLKSLIAYILNLDILDFKRFWICLFLLPWWLITNFSQSTCPWQIFPLIFLHVHQMEQKLDSFYTFKVSF